LRSLEEQLVERGQKILELEALMKKLELYAKTLSAELAAREERHGKPGADPEEMEALAQALAEREADLVAAQWTIGQLKQAALKD
jgi:cell division FtsZ-interacting protein ZapD